MAKRTFTKSNWALKTHIILKKIKMLLKKNIIVGKIKIYFLVYILSQFLSSNLYSDTKINSEDFVDLNVLDKVSSKSSNITLK